MENGTNAPVVNSTMIFNFVYCEIIFCIKCVMRNHFLLQLLSRILLQEQQQNQLHPNLRVVSTCSTADVKATFAFIVSRIQKLYVIYNTWGLERCQPLLSLKRAGLEWHFLCVSVYLLWCKCDIWRGLFFFNRNFLCSFNCASKLREIVLKKFGQPFITRVVNSTIHSKISKRLL